MSRKIGTAKVRVGSTDVEVDAEGIADTLRLHRPAEFTEPVHADEVLHSHGFQRKGAWSSRYDDGHNGDGFWAASLEVTR